MLSVGNWPQVLPLRTADSRPLSPASFTPARCLSEAGGDTHITCQASVGTRVRNKEPRPAQLALLLYRRGHVAAVTASRSDPP